MQPRILILDDEKLIRWSLSHILHQEGFEVDLAASTDEALRLARKRSYSLILADLEVCGDQAKTFFPSLVCDQPEPRVIIITALTSEQAERQLGDFKARRIIEKPFASEEILAAVKAALAGRDPEGQT